MKYRRIKLAGGTYFFTLVTEQRVPYFRNASVVMLIEKAICHVKERHPFNIIAYAYLPDHLHMI